MKKKNIIIVIVIMILLVGATFFVTRSVYKSKCTDKKEEKAATAEPAKIYEGEIPDFSIPVLGLFEGSFTDEDLKTSGIEVYSFTGDVVYSWGMISQKYVGFKFKDFLEYTKIKDFSEIEVIDGNGLIVTFEKDEISDDAFIILTRDGEQMVNHYVGYLDFKYLYNYSVEGIFSLIFK